MSSDLIRRYFAEVAFLTRELPFEDVSKAVQAVCCAHARGSSVYAIANGGSAATASHFARELVECGRSPDGRHLTAVALTDAVPILSEVANEPGCAHVLSEQLGVHAKPGDVLIALSPSGNSPDVVRCVELARFLGLTTIALAGFGGGQLARVADLTIRTPGSRIEVVEDVHSAICHAISVSVAVALGLNDATRNHTRRPAIFCDRDGVLNVRRLDHVKTVPEFEFAPGALGLLSGLRRFGVPVVVVTNQSVIGRGLATADDVERIHTHMQAVIAREGGPNLSIYMCPHGPEASCECRKPRPGLLFRAAVELNIALEGSVLIGDSLVDVFAALAAGCYPILVGSELAVGSRLPDDMLSCVSSLDEVIPVIEGRLAVPRSSGEPVPLG
jgi:D-sedoheptulose 7-phosphate isomerase